MFKMKTALAPRVAALMESGLSEEEALASAIVHAKHQGKKAVLTLKPVEALSSKAEEPSRLALHLKNDFKMAEMVCP